MAVCFQPHSAFALLLRHCPCSKIICHSTSDEGESVVGLIPVPKARPCRHAGDSSERPSDLHRQRDPCFVSRTTYHDVMLVVEEVRRVARVDNTGDVAIGTVEDRVGPFPNASVVAVQYTAGGIAGSIGGSVISA